MRKKSSLLLRLFVVTVMALGLATMLGNSASAQTEYSAQCQIAGEELDQDLECTVVYDQSAGTCTAIVGGTEYSLEVAACQQVAAGEPYQNLTAEGITQIIPEEDEAPAPTTPAATETPVTPTDDDDDDQAEELPRTGAGSTAMDSGSAGLLGVMSVLLMLAAGVIWRRREA